METDSFLRKESKEIDLLPDLLIGCVIDYIHEKRPTCMKRDVRIRKETNNADPCVWTQTYAYENREREGIDLLLDLLIGFVIDCIHEKRPTYTKRDLQCGPA